MSKGKKEKIVANVTAESLVEHGGFLEYIVRRLMWQDDNDLFQIFLNLSTLISCKYIKETRDVLQKLIDEKGL